MTGTGQQRRRTFLRYMAFQVPGWILVVGVSWLLIRGMELPRWTIGAALVVWIAKDLALYPLLRHAYEEDPRTGAERLIGTRGVVASALTPQGYVRVRGELWRAELRERALEVPAGRTVRICSARGLTLAVEPDRDDSPADLVTAADWRHTTRPGHNR